ncbi:MAG: efflux RND transporter permease subunit [Bryobacterales bacterium]|nr:efflux RND transporter permease subunit [Bryobacterales bacterium]
MLQALIDLPLRHRALVLVGLLAVIGWGIHTMFRLPIEAFPDLTNNQVVVITECRGMAPQEVEQLVSFPIETALMGIPRTQSIRSVSKLGLSMVTLVLDDEVPTYFARQLVNERLQEVRSRVPAGLEPSLGPVATAFGEVYQYTIGGGGLSPREIKTLHEWTIKNQLRTVRGVSEVNTWGGETAQVEIRVDPAKLRAYDLTLREVYERIRENNNNFSAGFIEHASEQYTVLGLGRARQAPDLANIVLRASHGTPLMLKDVAEVGEGALLRQGATLRDGRGETVSGMVIMLKGENGRDVIARAKERIASLTLPKGVRLLPFYDQSTVIDGTLATVRKNLLEAGVLVIAVLLLALGNFRAALIVAFAIPVSMLTGFIGMAFFGVTVNLMSLGAVDFGMIVDGAVVMVEHTVSRLHRDPEDSNFNPSERIRQAALEVGRPITFAVGIIIAVYLPILFLEGLEGKMFRPMAITVCSALLGSLGYALFVAPAAARYFLRHGVREHSSAWFSRLSNFYRSLLRSAIRFRPAVLAASLAVVSAALYSLNHIGSEFMPRLDEGSILITTRKLPGIALTDSVNLSSEIEKAIVEFREVAGVVTKLGRPDLATEAMGIYEADVYITFKPGIHLHGVSKERFISRMAERLERIPGVSYNFTQPMAMRLDEVVSGIKADLALKLFGDDPAVLTQIGERALRVLTSIPGSADAQLEITIGVPELRIVIDRPAVARYGLNVSDVEQAVRSAVQGEPLSELVLGNRRIPVVGKITAAGGIHDPAGLAALPLHAPGGERIPLSLVANVVTARGAEVISREGGRRRVVVQSNVRGRDLGSFAAEAQRRVAAEITLPAGYSVDWGGQFENQERAMNRLGLVIPLSLAIIFGLLYATFHSLRQALLLILIVPFSLAGGVAALWLRGMNLNLSALVGFIALSGVAVLNGIVMVSAINHLRQLGHSMDHAVLEGAASRLRPVLMTALVASFGFLPMALTTTTGAEVQRPLASVVIGGLVSATALTLVLLPLLYPWFSRHHPRD